VRAVGRFAEGNDTRRADHGHEREQIREVGAGVDRRDWKCMGSSPAREGVLRAMSDSRERSENYAQRTAHDDRRRPLHQALPVRQVSVEPSRAFNPAGVGC